MSVVYGRALIVANLENAIGKAAQVGNKQQDGQRIGISAREFSNDGYHL